MMLFHSPLTLALLLAAVLVFIGARGKKGHVLSFFGALCCVCTCAAGLLLGASWQEALICVLTVLLADQLGRGRAA